MRFFQSLIIAASIIFLSCGREDLDSLPVYFISGEQVYSIDFDGGNFKRLTDDANTYESVSSSMDGEDILLSDSSGKMYLMNYKGGTPVYFMDGKYGTYGPSGNIYYIKNNDTISKCDSAGGNPVDIITITGNIIYSLSCNRDETEISFGYSPGGPSYTARLKLNVLPYSYLNISGIFDNIHPSYSPLNYDILGTMSGHTVIKVFSDSSYITIDSTSSLSSTPAWSPDGEYVFFGKNIPNPKEIIRMKRDGSEKKVIATISTNISAFSVMGKPR